LPGLNKEKAMLVSSTTHSFTARLESFAPYALALLRVVVAYLFIQHGTAKLFGVPHVPAMDGVQLMSLIGASAVLELVGGALLLIGLFVRPTAFILSGEMAVAYFMVHAAQGNVLIPMLNGGEPAVLYCFIFLALAALGGGAWTLDKR
jgi:putative oxidoreductase